ncbi:unnamed protein product, partial [Porites evermanni]
GRGIKCYQCDSAKSWDHCVPGSNTECSAGLDSCVKFEGQAEFQGVTRKYFYKGCALKSRCTDKVCKIVLPSSATIKKCDVSCCQSDLCNGAKVPVVSGFLFLACALVAFFFLNRIFSV